jgi:DNA-binding FadR family transcriptional regulator
MPENQRQQGIGFLLNQSARNLRNRLAAELANHGLDDATYIVLRNAAPPDETAATPAGIASSLHMPIESIREAVARLARDGWIVPGAGEGTDSAELRLSDKAVRLMPGFEDIGHWTIESALNGFTAAEIAELSDFLERILNNLG